MTKTQAAKALDFYRTRTATHLERANGNVPIGDAYKAMAERNASNAARRDVVEVYGVTVTEAVEALA